VYRARELKLDREVAVKFLPDAMACDPKRLARFEREAKVLAALNHPQHRAHLRNGGSERHAYACSSVVYGPTLSKIKESVSTESKTRFIAPAVAVAVAVASCASYDARHRDPDEPGGYGGGPNVSGRTLGAAWV